MRVLILGGTGMLGHKAYQALRHEFDTIVTMRVFGDRVKRTGVFDESQVIEGVDAFACDSVDRAIARTRPDVVLNAIGVIKYAIPSIRRRPQPGFFSLSGGNRVRPAVVG